MYHINVQFRLIRKDKEYKVKKLFILYSQLYIILYLCKDLPKRKISYMKKLTALDMNRIGVEEFKKSRKTPLVVILDDVRSMYNVGSVFRTADAFRIESIYLCGITSCPPHPEIHKTALGAEDSVDWKYFHSTMEAVVELKQAGYEVWSIEQVEGSTMLQNFIPSKEKKYAVVFGNEVQGVKQEVVDNSDGCIEIPQFGTKHSLNVSTTAGIVMWNFVKSLQITD